MTDWWSSDSTVSPSASSDGWWNKDSTINAPSISAPKPTAPAQPSAAPMSGTAPVSGELKYRSSLLPLGKTQEGNIVPAIPGVITETAAAVRDFMNAGTAGPPGSREVTKAAVGPAANIAAIAGPVEGLGAARAAESVAPPLEAAVPTARDELAAASERQGVPISKAVASSSPMLQRGAQALKDIPILGDPLTKASDQSIAALNEATKSAAASYGSGSVETAGQAATKAMKDWITGPIDEATDLRTGSAAINQRTYGLVDRLASSNYAQPPTALKTAVDFEIAKRQNMGLMQSGTELDKLRQMGLSPNAIDQVVKQLGPSAAPVDLAGAGPTTKMIMGAVNKSGGMTYQGLKDLRTNIGDMMSGRIVPEPGTDQPLLKSYYGALTQDMRDTLSKGSGQDALNAFDKANRVAAKIADRREALSSIVGAKGDAAPAEVLGRIEQLAGSRSTADIQTLVKARKAVGPEVWDEMSSAIINRMGRDAEGNFSGDRFLTAYGSKAQETTKGLSPAGKNVLFRSTGETERAQALDDIATLSSAAKNMARFASTSRSGSPTALLTLGALAVASPVKAIGAALGGNVAARILASPISVKPAAQWSKAYVAASRSQTSENMQKLAGAARPFALTVAKDLGLDFQKTYQSLNSLVPANAANNAANQ